MFSVYLIREWKLRPVKVNNKDFILDNTIFVKNIVIINPYYKEIELFFLDCKSWFDSSWDVTILSILTEL